MPFHRRFRPRFRRRPFRRHRGGNPYGAPVRRPRWNRAKRVAQNLTREVRWFKQTESIVVENNPQGWVRDRVGNTYDQINNLIQFQKFGRIWEQYKVLKIIVKYYPVNNGGESLSVGQGINTFVPRFFKGTCVTWCDQTPPVDSPITNIVSAMGKPSARLNSGNRFIKRWIDRPRSGFPTWGTLETNGVILEPSQDSWTGAIILFGSGFTPPNVQVQPPMDRPTYYYRECIYKIMFRSRQED